VCCVDDVDVNSSFFSGEEARESSFEVVHISVISDVFPGRDRRGRGCLRGGTREEME
jgi:hypothetical protein